MSRIPIYTLLSTNSALNALGISATSLLGVASQVSPTIRPWAVIKWQDETPFVKNVSSQIMQVWVFDEPGSYDNINKIIKKVRELLDANVDLVDSASGERYSTSKWMGTSAELYDDIYKCIVRYVTFTIV